MSYWRMAWIGIFLGVLIWSGIRPAEYGTWVLEVLPAVLGALILWRTRTKFTLTTSVYVLILIHCVLLMVGGHYTYAEVPLFNWIEQEFGHTRNNYDKVGHFAQGFVPAMIARELVIRKNVFKDMRWRNFFIIFFCLGFSALYELIEWWVALLSDDAADSFLGTQGYIWDTQSDMFWALIGAIMALAILGRLHDRQLSEKGVSP